MSTPSKLSELLATFDGIAEHVRDHGYCDYNWEGLLGCGHDTHGANCPVTQVRNALSALSAKDAELEQQSARIKTLEAALEPFGSVFRAWTGEDFRRAAAALKGEG